MPSCEPIAENLDRRRVEVLGINPWKRWQLDPFLRPRFGAVHYARTPAQALQRQALHGGCIAVWAAREPPQLSEAASRQSAALIRIEDGFLRSVGLGSNRVGGASLVLDAEGIYFDPRRPSRLERLLQQGGFEAGLLARAARLRQLLAERGLTKYNLGSATPFRVGGAGCWWPGRWRTTPRCAAERRAYKATWNCCARCARPSRRTGSSTSPIRTPKPPPAPAASNRSWPCNTPTSWRKGCRPLPCSGKSTQSTP
jgi:hypothetical protein